MARTTKIRYSISHKENDNSYGSYDCSFSEEVELEADDDVNAEKIALRERVHKQVRITMKDLRAKYYVAKKE